MSAPRNQASWLMRAAAAFAVYDAVRSIEARKRRSACSGSRARSQAAKHRARPWRGDWGWLEAQAPTEAQARALVAAHLASDSFWLRYAGEHAPLVPGDLFAVAVGDVTLWEDRHSGILLSTAKRSATALAALQREAGR